MQSMTPSILVLLHHLVNQTTLLYNDLSIHTFLCWLGEKYPKKVELKQIVHQFHSFFFPLETLYTKVSHSLTLTHSHSLSLSLSLFLTLSRPPMLDCIAAQAGGDPLPLPASSPSPPFSPSPRPHPASFFSATAETAVTPAPPPVCPFHSRMAPCPMRKTRAPAQPTSPKKEL